MPSDQQTLIPLRGRQALRVCEGRCVCVCVRLQEEAEEEEEGEPEQGFLWVGDDCSERITSRPSADCLLPAL